MRYRTFACSTLHACERYYKYMQNNDDRISDNNKPLKPEGQKRYKLIACEIFYREICKLVSESDHLIDIEFLRKGLHDIETKEMLATIQEAVNNTEPDTYEAILLAYARCNDGLTGLYTDHYPLVIPRSHDCIGIFFGGCDKYKEFFDTHPGTYYRTSGWTERDYSPEDSVMTQLGLNFNRQEYIEKYGEANADYIMETMGNWTEKYQYLAYIDMGLKIDQKYIELAQKEAHQKGLEFMLVKGSITILKNLVSGIWPDKEFLIIPPGYKITAENTGKILDIEKITH